MIPASPCTGSTRNAAVSGVIARSSASASPYGTVDSPVGNGPNPSRYCGSVESPVIVIVRPWKLPSHAMIAARPSGMPLILWPHLRAALIAVSTASAPPLAGSTRSEPRDARQALHQLRQPVVVVRARRDRELLRLLDQRADDARMRMAEADRRVRAHQVEQPAALDVGDPRTFAARQHDGQRLVVERAGLLLARDQCIRAREGLGTGRRGDVSPAGTLLHAETPCERCRARANRSAVDGTLGRGRRSCRG